MFNNNFNNSGMLITHFYEYVLSVNILCMRTHFIHNKPKTHNWQLWYLVQKSRCLGCAKIIMHGHNLLIFTRFDYCIIFFIISFGGNGWKGGDLNHGN